MTETPATSTSPPPFDPALWTGFWKSARLGLEYLAALHRDNYGRIDPGPLPDDAALRAELKVVAAKRREADRDPERVRRILEQDGKAANLLLPWGLELEKLDKVMPTLAWLVNHLALAASRMPLMHFKHHYNLARPYELDRTIQPLVGNPGHPSYPSGHTCQHYYAALVIEHVGQPIEVELAGGDSEALRAVRMRRDAMFAVANDAAENREYAGVHYPADTAAGRRLASKMFEIMRETLKEPLEEASKEWRAWRSFGRPSDVRPAHAPHAL